MASVKYIFNSHLNVCFVSLSTNKWHLHAESESVTMTIKVKKLPGELIRSTGTNIGAGLFTRYYHKCILDSYRKYRYIMIPLVPNSWKTLQLAVS